MDKEWIHLPSRLVPEYEEGVQKFIAQAKDYAKTREVILCPCIRCKNKKYMTFDKVYEHLIIKGFDPTYKIWFFHGEISTPQFQGEGSSLGVQEDEHESREAFHLYRDVFVSDEVIGHTISDTKDYEFADLLEDAETPLFPGGGSGIGNDIGCDYDIHRPKKNGNVDNVDQRQVAMQSNLKNMSCGYIAENTKCKLLHWCGDGVVAEGRIASTDPNIKVHHVPLGGSCWKVWVDRVLVEHVDLIRPNSEMTFLEEAIGSTIAWFSKFIVLCE